MTSDRVSGSVRRRRRGVVARLRLPFALVGVALAVFAAYGLQQRLSARTALDEGEKAFRSGDFLRAADRFQAVLARDPASTTVRLRLAAALAERSAALLAEASGPVLDAEARAGLIPAAFAVSASAPVASGHPIADDRLRRALADRWSGAIAEGIDTAAKALTIDGAHEHAMLTLEGWHQLAADLAPSADEYRRHMTSAAEWRRKALAARRVEAERSSR